MLWDVATRERLAGKPLAVAEGSVLSGRLGPEGKTLAAGYAASSDNPVGGVVLWDVASRERLAGQPWPWAKATS